MEKHKAIAIPVCYIDQKAHFLLVHDRRYKEWTFVTGGCRKREVYNPLRCAVRELEEETRGILNFTDGTYKYFKFTTDEGAIYHVYIFDTVILDQPGIEKQFLSEKHKMETQQMAFRKNYDENDFLEFDTLEGISKRNIWPLITKHIIQNPEFYCALRSSERQSFSLKY
jgi:8-oxo-dGTP pyrophosphatase MutT (NUDIX family)